MYIISHTLSHSLSLSLHNNEAYPIMDKTTASQDQPAGHNNEVDPIMNKATASQALLAGNNNDNPIMNWESSSSGSSSSGWHSAEDEFAHLVKKRPGGRKGSHSEDPDYNPEDEVW